MSESNGNPTRKKLKMTSDDNKDDKSQNEDSALLPKKKLDEVGYDMKYPP